MRLNHVASVALGATLLLTSACKDPSKDKPAATVAPAGAGAGHSESAAAHATPDAPVASPDAAAATTDMATVVPDAAAMAPAGTSLTLDPTNTKLGFVGSKVTGSHEGNFPALTGKVVINGQTPASVEVEIDMTALTADNEKLTGHLKSPDFFDVEKHPKATFKSSAIAVGGEAGATHTITGELSLHGVTKTIGFPATIAITDAAVTAQSEFSINRKDFEVAYAGKPDDLIRDGVVLKLSINIPRM